MKLSFLYSFIQKQDPDLTDPDIEQYCTQSDIPAPEWSLSSEAYRRATPYYYGYNSLKWAMFQIQAIDPKRVKHVFKAILIEQKARQKSIDDLQFRIMKYAAVAEYRQQIRENTKDRIDLADLSYFEAGDFNIVINQTGHNLTSRIMRDTNADAILFIEPDLCKAGLQIRVNSKMNQLEGFKHYFLSEVSAIEPGWTFVGESKNLIINHGSENKTPSSFTIETLQQIIESYFV